MLKKVIITCGLSLFAMFGLACQKTPEKPIVIAKDQTVLIEKAQATPDNASATKAPASQSKYVASVTGSTPDFSVRVDATIETPANQTMSIIRVTPAEFSQELAEKMYDYLCSGTNMYYEEQLNTKPAIEKMIMDAKQQISNGQDTDGGLQAYVDHLEKMYESASDEAGEPVTKVEMLEKTISSFQYHIFDVYSTLDKSHGKQFSIRTNSIPVVSGQSPRSDSTFQYINFDLFPLTSCQMVEKVTGQSTAPSISGLKMTPLEAQQAAEQFLKEVGMEGYRVSNVFLMDNGVVPEGDTLSADLDYLYEVYFQRVIHGIPVTSPTYMTSVGGADTGLEWEYERFFMQINDQGIFHIYWSTPLNIGETVVDASNLLPFDEITEIFENMMRIKYEPLLKTAGSYQTLHYDVTRVTLTYQRISEMNSITAGLLVPVWNFYGTATGNANEQNEIKWGDAVDDFVEPFLSINAIDGSVIDIKLGY